MGGRLEAHHGCFACYCLVVERKKQVHNPNAACFPFHNMIIERREKHPYKE